MKNGNSAAVLDETKEQVKHEEPPPGFPPAEPEAEQRPEKPTEWRVNGIAFGITLGKWRGKNLVVDRSSPPDKLIVLYAKDDEEPMPWGRALEELLADLLAKAEAAGDGS